MSFGNTLNFFKARTILRPFNAAGNDASGCAGEAKYINFKLSKFSIFFCKLFF